jgi:hypothetical protein
MHGSQPVPGARGLRLWSPPDRRGQIPLTGSGRRSGDLAPLGCAQPRGTGWRVPVRSEAGDPSTHAERTVGSQADTCSSLAPS